jgi:hypothetical protein
MHAVVVAAQQRVQPLRDAPRVPQAGRQVPAGVGQEGVHDGVVDGAAEHLDVVEDAGKGFFRGGDAGAEAGAGVVDVQGVGG